MGPKRTPSWLYARMYGKYVPRVNVDTVILAPGVECFGTFNGVEPRFNLGKGAGIALVQRDIPPKIGTWHLAGGSLYRGESVEVAAKRIVRGELGIEIDILTKLPHIEFPAEQGQVKVGGVMLELVLDNISVVLLARARTSQLRGSKDGKNVGWYTRVPPNPHPEHVPYLVKHGFLTA